MADAQSQRTHCPQGHPYDEANTTLSQGRRHCRTCNRERQRKGHPPRTTAEILWARFRFDASGCWLWTSSITAAGYGTYGKPARLAHRMMYELIVGEIAEGLTIDHLCRVRACVNPVHLEPVTRGENVLRGESLPAQNARKMACPKGHPYDEENTWRSPVSGWRMCRTCNREKARRNRARVVSR